MHWYEVLPSSAGHFGTVVVAVCTVPVIDKHRQAVCGADQNHQPPRPTLCIDHYVETGIVLAKLRFELLTPGAEQGFEGSSKARPVACDGHGWRWRCGRDRLPLPQKGQIRSVQPSGVSEAIGLGQLQGLGPAHRELQTTLCDVG